MSRLDPYISRCDNSCANDDDNNDNACAQGKDLVPIGCVPPRNHTLKILIELFLISLLVLLLHHIRVRPVHTGDKHLLCMSSFVVSESII